MHIALLKHQIQQAKNSLTGTPLSSDFIQIAVAGFLHESVLAGMSATQSKKRKQFIHSSPTVVWSSWMFGIRGQENLPNSTVTV